MRSLGAVGRKADTQPMAIRRRITRFPALDLSSHLCRHRPLSLQISGKDPGLSAGANKAKIAGLCDRLDHAACWSASRELLPREPASWGLDSCRLRFPPGMVN